LTVADVLLPPGKIPVVTPATLLKKTLEIMGDFRLGIASIVDDDGKLAGIFTDGDIRRMLLKDQKPFPALFADDIIQHATKSPTTISPRATLVDAVAVMEDMEIWDLPVVSDDGAFVGLLHLHPAIKAVMET
jgi:arabinose-5-phosphate isomerase